MIKKLLQILISFLFLLIFSCNKNDEKVYHKIPHPDSIGVGTMEYLQGEKDAKKDLINMNYKLYLRGNIPLDSLKYGEMKKYFKLKYNLTFEYLDSTSAYQNGYNNKMVRALKERYDINIKKELHKYYNR